MRVSKSKLAVSPKLLRGVPVLPALFSLALLMAACSGDSKSNGGILSGGTDAAPAGRDALISMLAQVPDKPDLRRTIEFTDYAKLRNILGVKTPSGQESADEAAAYWHKLVDSGVFQFQDTNERSSLTTGDGKATSVPETMQAYSEQFGYNAVNLDQDIQVDSNLRGGRLDVLHGRFDPAKIDAAVKSDKTFYQSLLNQMTYAGRTLYVWGEDNKQYPQGGKNLARNTAYGGRITVDKSSLLYSTNTDDLKKMIDTSDKKGPSLADVDDLRLLATKLQSLPIYQGEIILNYTSLDGEIGDLVRGEYGRDAAGKQRIEEFLPNALKQFTVVAAGQGKDSKGALNVIVYVHADEATAAANESRLKYLVDKHVGLSDRFNWSTKTTSSQITRDGRVLTLQLWTDGLNMTQSICDNLDALCLWR